MGDNGGRVHRAVQVRAAGGPLELVEVGTPPPGAGHVRLDVSACGVCGTDQHFVNGVFPGLSWPITPGHEIAGTVAEVGPSVEDVRVGERVVVGWFGGNCGHCAQCRAGQLLSCENGQVPSWHYPGGYAESVTVPATALARIPDGLSFVEAAPMSCAGVTVFNALRRTAATPGDRVAVLGLGGLGHLGVQFARAMGFETVAVARGAGKAADATELGAHHYVDSTAAGDVGEALRRLGGVSVVLATAANSAAIGATLGGLRPRGELVVVGATPEPLPISPFQLLTANVRVTGHLTGTAGDVEETLRFAVLSGVRPRVQREPLEQAADAYAAMAANKARYRMVLTTGTG
jgi:alcohol dehydrogenase